jgi:hypothetical protein
MNDINQELYKFYKDKLTRFDLPSQKVGWKNEEAQIIRFRQFLHLLLPDNSKFILNDLGCGMGAFIDFLKEFKPEFYFRGYDIVDEMISFCINHFNSADFSFHLINQSREMKMADYTICSGIFNIKGDLREVDWMPHVVETISDMNTVSRKGFAFNILSSYSDPEFQKPDLYYADPLFYFDYCKKNFSKNVALLHDYGQFDFTIIVKK